METALKAAAQEIEQLEKKIDEQQESLLYLKDEVRRLRREVLLARKGGH